jgi:hypothetical protein
VSDRPEITDEAIADDEAAVQRRVPIGVMQVPRLLGGMLADIRSIAEGMAVLPKLLSTLEEIQGRVESLDGEVKQMRASVESMGGDVSELQGDISRLEPHLEDVSRVAHPLRRIGERARRRDGGS